MSKNLSSPSIKESIARVEEQIFKAEQEGNTRQVKVLRLVLKRLKNLIDKLPIGKPRGFFGLKQGKPC